MNICTARFLIELEAILKRIERKVDIMTAQNDLLVAEIAGLKASNDKLVALDQSIKAALDAALANPNGLTPDEAAALVAQIRAIRDTDDATVLADTPTTP